MNWKDALFEHEPPKTPVVTPHKVSYVPSDAPQVRITPANVDSVIATAQQVCTGPAYATLKAKTSFDTTNAGMILKKYLDPLLSLPLEDKMKVKTAQAQAQAIEGLTVDKILTSFDTLKTVLSDESRHFEQMVASKSSDIAARQVKIDELTKQLNDLRGEQAGAQEKVVRAESDFQHAVQVRMTELDQERNRYEGFLK